MIKPTRKTQPYRKGARQPTGALMNMLRGRTLYGYNPQDTARAVQRGRRGGGGLSAALRRRKRP